MTDNIFGGKPETIRILRPALTSKGVGAAASYARVIQ